MTPIVPSPFLLMAGLIKHSKLCLPTLKDTKAFLEGHKTRFKLKQKTDSHQPFGPRMTAILFIVLGSKVRWEKSPDPNLSHPQRLHSRYVLERTWAYFLTVTRDCCSYTSFQTGKLRLKWKIPNSLVQSYQARRERMLRLTLAPSHGTSPT